ncbi:YciI family protein [Inhella sp.]|uniref:YciI family protein n=1 Tax=Inhella sp. TaxID=1921806 RepID=UPI0035ADAEB0
MTSTSLELSGDFLILAQDAPGVGARLLALAQLHWAYTDRFAEILAFRGPLLSDDGTQHAGSLHLLRATDAATAQRFAEEEPYHRAGLFDRVSVQRMRVLRCVPAGTPDDAPAGIACSFVSASWAPRALTSTPAPDSVGWPWLLLGLMLNHEGLCQGAAGVLTEPPTSAQGQMRAWLRDAGFGTDTVQAHRWRRGGRR